MHRSRHTCARWGSRCTLPPASAPPADSVNNKPLGHYTQLVQLHKAYALCPLRLPFHCHSAPPFLAAPFTQTSANMQQQRVLHTAAHMQKHQHSRRHASGHTSCNIKQHGTCCGSRFPAGAGLCLAQRPAQHGCHSYGPQPQPAAHSWLAHRLLPAGPGRGKLPPHHMAAGGNKARLLAAPPLHHPCAAGQRSAHAQSVHTRNRSAPAASAALASAKPACTIRNEICKACRPPGSLHNSLANAAVRQLPHFICTAAHATNICILSKAQSKEQAASGMQTAQRSAPHPYPNRPAAASKTAQPAQAEKDDTAAANHTCLKT